MEHSIYNPEMRTEIVIDETQCENVCIHINDLDDEEKNICHYLTPVDLHDFIGTLLHVQAKKRKGVK